MFGNHESNCRGVGEGKGEVDRRVRREQSSSPNDKGFEKVQKI